ncbi:MAG TPA: hypothetical protein VKZ51_00450, partial [Cyclobacteriaceae bacterium]|nr:hypothetical protein [Cyclobacteriaceae bacterium]
WGRKRCRTIVLMSAYAFIFPIFSSNSQSIEEGHYQQEEVFIHQAKGSAEAEVKLLSDQSGNPVMYTSHLISAVCSDGICKPIDIHLYWDLLGKFYRYQTSDEEELTKFDHEPFTEEDHARLHEILSDENSILQDYEVEDLIDTDRKLHSDEIDGVTGATNITFRDASVEGAMYTVYTLWHFINGDVRNKIFAHTKSLLSESLIRYMLQSEKGDYHNFIFNNLSDSQRKKFAPEIISLISSKDIYTPHFAIQQLTDDVLADSIHQAAVLEQFASVPPVVQNSLLARIESQPIYNVGIRALLESVPQLASNQLDRVFLIIGRNKASIDKLNMKALKNLTLQPEKDFSYFAERILDQVSDSSNP